AFSNSQFGILRFGLFLSLFLPYDSTTAAIYSLSLHDALPIFTGFDLILGLLILRLTKLIDQGNRCINGLHGFQRPRNNAVERVEDRKSTRLNSSHVKISYAVFCLKKNKIFLIVVEYIFA